MKPSKPSTSIWKAAGLVSALGVDFAVCMLLGYFGGSYASRVTGQSFWIVVGILLGLIVGILSIILVIKLVLEGSDG